MSVILEDDTPPPPPNVLLEETEEDDIVIEMRPTRPTRTRSQHRVPRPPQSVSLSDGCTNHEDSSSCPSSAQPQQFGPDRTQHTQNSVSCSK